MYVCVHMYVCTYVCLCVCVHVGTVHSYMLVFSLGYVFIGSMEVVYPTLRTVTSEQIATN